MMILAVGETMVIITRNVRSFGRFRARPIRLVNRRSFRPLPQSPCHFGLPRRLWAWAVLCGVVQRSHSRPGPSCRAWSSTLGTLYVIRGVDAIFVNGVQINPSSIPDSFIGIGYETVLDIPWMFIIASVLVVIVGYIMRTFRPARDLLRHRVRPPSRPSGWSNLYGAGCSSPLSLGGLLPASRAVLGWPTSLP